MIHYKTLILYLNKFILLSLLLALILFGRCDKTKVVTEGYNCINGNCSAVFENPQYLTLIDCQSACGSGNNSTSGYNCVNGNCVAVSNNANYSTLSACQSACAIVTGSVDFYPSFDPPTFHGAIIGCVKVTIGIGYTSTDVANEAYFAQSPTYTYPLHYIVHNLIPGVYYYRAKKAQVGCGTGLKDVINSSSFTIASGHVTPISISL